MEPGSQQGARKLVRGKGGRKPACEGQGGQEASKGPRSQEGAREPARGQGAHNEPGSPQ